MTFQGTCPVTDCQGIVTVTVRPVSAVTGRRTATGCKCSGGRHPELRDEQWLEAVGF